MPELPKAYTPSDVEADIYRRWEASGFFNPDNLPLARRRKPFSIAMPPPNITGELHIGHALGFTVQDALTRYQRMRGRAALWIPGPE
jgi:valyl-tRNA synthetase